MSAITKAQIRAHSTPGHLGASAHTLFKVIMRDLRSMWSIMGILVFLAAAWPLFQLTMQYHYSAKGSILSSAIAATFGGFLLVSRRSTSEMWTQRLAALSPFVLTTLIYLVIPHSSGLIYALTLSLLTQILAQRMLSSSHAEGSRSQLLSKLSSLSSEQCTAHLQKLFFYWAALSFTSGLLHRTWPSQYSVYIPLLAFAVFSGAVQNCRASEESK